MKASGVIYHSEWEIDEAGIVKSDFVATTFQGDGEELQVNSFEEIQSVQFDGAKNQTQGKLKNATSAYTRQSPSSVLSDRRPRIIGKLPLLALFSVFKKIGFKLPRSAVSLSRVGMGVVKKAVSASTIFINVYKLFPGLKNVIFKISKFFFRSASKVIDLLVKFEIIGIKTVNKMVRLSANATGKSLKFAYPVSKKMLKGTGKVGLYGAKAAYSIATNRKQNDMPFRYMVAVVAGIIVFGIVILSTI